MSRKPHTPRDLLLKIVKGQIRSFMSDHPEAVSSDWCDQIEQSLGKRIVGDLLSASTLKGLSRLGRVKQ